MLLINIGENILVNPEKIDAVELIITKDGKKEMVVYVNGKRFTATKNIETFLRQLNQPDLSNQFYAG